MKKWWSLVKEHLCKLLIVMWSIVVGFASKEYFYDYVQKQANSHYDITYVDMGMPLLFLVFGALAIGKIRKRKFFCGIMYFGICLWAVYIFAETRGITCFQCGAGG